MANPDNALGTNGAFGGRTSVNAFNDVLSTFSGRGVLSGWECVPDSGLDVNIGGVSGTRDVAIAEDPGGNKTTVNNISQAPVSVTLPAAPASNSRIDSIVAYIESSPSSDAALDNPDAVNLLVVSGSTAASPAAPTDSQIRTAITGDGASGATAYYVVLANVTMAAGVTDIDATMISAGAAAGIGTEQISDGAVTADKIDFATFDYAYSVAPGVDSVGAGDTLINQITIPREGKYFILCVNDVNVMDHSIGDANIRLTKSSTTIDGTTIYFNNIAGRSIYYIGGITNSCIIDAEEGDIIKCIARTGQSIMGFPASRGCMMAIRIG